MKEMVKLRVATLTFILLERFCSYRLYQIFSVKRAD